MSNFIISLDFEMFWGVADVRTVDEYGDHIRGELEAIPAMLAAFGRHRVRATWATVGMLMCRDHAHWRAVAPERLPAYARSGCSPYAMDATVRKYPTLFFAPELVKRIRDSEGQEVATHTFSHFYCGEPGATPEQFMADMQCARAVGADLGLAFTSIVFPRNQVLPAYLRVLPETGVKIYRSNPDHVLYRDGHQVPGGALGRLVRLADAWLPLAGAMAAYPAHGPGALVALPASRFLRPFSPSLAALEPLRLRRIKAAMTQAAIAGSDFHLWWHPHNFGCHTGRNLVMLEAILNHFGQLRERYGMRSANMADFAGRAKA
ncbi:polysaccharide deacetylase family protein [Massilia sp. PAMC28688]|uniref:polysaccharide deacetylase family protein n=1 Tax=Massilia sp. PAMC28688 TaxID=2861283 RepID=UPI001C62D86B|nr:polysaccharide deacetylase family protein [Massilia sp. PAMC28688]QYF91984.1 polysaccharide deacetylase family protein [Massilia sp. PAMC28688]